MIKSAKEYVFYSEAAAERFSRLTENGAVATFIYSPNVLAGGATKTYDPADKGVRTVAVSGVTHVPCRFFTDFLGATLTKEAGCAKITLGSATACASVVLSGGREVLPLAEVAEALGLSVGSFYEGRLTVVGSAAAIAEIAADEEMQKAGAYLVVGKYDPYSLTPADYKATRAKWRRRLVGTPELNDLTNATVKEKIDYVSREGKKAWSQMNKSADRVILWGDKPPVESEELHNQYFRLRTLALAWGTCGSELYGNEELRRDIKDGVEWMYRNMYGEAEIAGTGWRDAHLFNWYFWYITPSEYLSDIFFIMEDDFTLEEKRKYFKCFEWCTTFMRTPLDRACALSRICSCTKVGLACENPDRLYDELVDFDMLLGLEEHAEGPRIDYCQWTHGMPYNNAYGKLNLDRVLHVASILAGTPAEFVNPKQYNQFELVKYMFEPAMYKGQAMIMFCGRSTNRSEEQTGGAILGDMLQMYGMFGEDEDEYLARLIKRSAEEPEVLDWIKKHTTIEGCATIDAIMADASVPSDGDYEYAHAWFTGDRAAQHRTGYAIGLALSSKREPSWESINSANKTGWHTGDGATYLYTNYDKHPFDGANFLCGNINIAYRFPGTTEDARERTARSISSPRAWRSPNAFAGSMQIDDKYIVAGMDFVSYNFTGEDDIPDDSDYGGGLPVHENDLVAKKAWFCLDGRIVCLGAGITSTMDSPVSTTLEHRRIVNPERDNQYLDGALLPKSEYEKRDTGARYITMEGHASYVILDGNAYVRRYTHAEAAGQSFFEIGLDHSKNPEGATYAYAILPYADCERAAELAAGPDIKIIANDERLQAVYDPATKITGYVFHAAGDKNGIACDSPAIITVGRSFLSVSDPTREAEQIKITVWREIEITAKDKRMDVDIAGGKTVITVDMREANGRRFDMSFVPWENDNAYKVDYTEADAAEFKALTEDGATALFLYCKNVMSKGEIHPVDDGDKSVRTVSKDGEVMAPVSFFERFLGKTPDKSGAYICGGREYLPAAAAARALGFAAESFYAGRLVVIGKPEHIEAMHENPALEEAGAYAVFGKYDATSFTSADYKLAKDEWRARLVGSKEINDTTDPAIAGKLSYRDRLCDAARNTLNREEGRVILWGDAAPVESEDLWTQYRRCLDMALAWGTCGCKNYHDEGVLADIIDSFDWLCENMYGEREIAGTGWRNVHEFNWWHWFFGAPEALTDAMLIIENRLTAEDKERYLKCYRWLRTVMMTNPKSNGASRLTVGAKAALLLEDARLLFDTHRDCDSCMGNYEYGATIHKADYCNWTHFFPHNVSYGVINLQRALFVASILAKTPLGIAGPKAYNQFNLIKYSFEPSMYRAQGFVMFSGRSTFGVEQSYGASILAAALPMIGTFGEEEDAYVKRFVKRHAVSEEIITSIKNQSSIYDCAKLKEILEDESIPSDNDYEYAHAWFTGDRAAQHRSDYAIGLAMSSRREKAWECINGANKTGWYTGDGATYLYTTYDGHRFDGKNFLLNNIGVAYRFPGTTEDDRPRVARSIANAGEWYPKNAFAGSMQIDGKYIVAGMDFISLNFEGPDDHPDDYGYGGGQPIHLNDLVAKKAWFCLDDQIVCLGAGITSTMDSPVSTTLEHTRIVSAECDDQYLDGELLPKSDYEKRDTGARYITMTGHASYVILDGNAYVRRYTHAEAEGQSFFEIGLAHGKNPEGATYAYAILPYANCERAAEYAKTPAVKILANDPSVQAVYEPATGIRAYVFHEAGELDGIRVGAPCMLSVTEREGKRTLSVTDPTHKLDSLTVELDGGISVISKSANIAVSERDGKTVLCVNTFMKHGRKFEVTYE